MTEAKPVKVLTCKTKHDIVISWGVEQFHQQALMQLLTLLMFYQVISDVKDWDSRQFDLVQAGKLKEGSKLLTTMSGLSEVNA